MKKRKRWREQTSEMVPVEELRARYVRPSDALLRELLHSQALSPASRAVVVLHFQEEMSLPDVAAVLEIPLETVKSRLAYGLAALRARLGVKRSG